MDKIIFKSEISDARCNPCILISNRNWSISGFEKNNINITFLLRSHPQMNLIEEDDKFGYPESWLIPVHRGMPDPNHLVVFDIHNGDPESFYAVLVNAPGTRIGFIEAQALAHDSGYEVKEADMVGIWPISLPPVGEESPFSVTGPKKFFPDLSLEETVAIFEAHVKDANPKDVREDGFIHSFINAKGISTDILEEVKALYLEAGWKDVMIAPATDSPGMLSVHFIAK